MARKMSICCGEGRFGSNLERKVEPRNRNSQDILSGLLGMDGKVWGGGCRGDQPL